MVLLRLVYPTKTPSPKRAKDLLSVLIIALCITSCGQKGPLRMPEHKQRATEQHMNQNTMITPAQLTDKRTEAHVSLSAIQIENTFKKATL